MRYFYSHIIDIESIIVELDEMELSDNEKSHLAFLIDSAIHSSVLDAIMSQLSEEDKKLFIKHLNSASHEKTLEFLNSKVDNIEEKIKQSAEEIKKELHKDLKEAKELKKSS